MFRLISCICVFALIVTYVTINVRFTRLDELLKSKVHGEILTYFADEGYVLLLVLDEKELLKLLCFREVGFNYVKYEPEIVLTSEHPLFSAQIISIPKGRKAQQLFVEYGFCKDVLRADIIYGDRAMAYYDVKYKQGCLLRVTNIEEDPLQDLPGRYLVNTVTLYGQGMKVIEEIKYD